MAITLRIDNFDQLPDGGPIEFSAGARGFDIGRETHLDWSLPDPNRVISGHHAQVRYEAGAYWLHDISRNGTFVNGDPGRVKSPYRLNNGDRLQIGQYFISVGIGAEGGQAAMPAYSNYAPPPPPQPASGGDMWSTGSATPPAADRRWFANEQRGARAPDVLDQYVDMPNSRPGYSPFGGSGTGIGAPLAPDSRIPQQAPGYPQPGGQRPQPSGFGGSSPSDFLAALAGGAGISAQAFAGRDPQQVAAELGQLLRIVTEQLSALLAARAVAKRMTKSANRTMIGVQNNNPLKFIPDPAEALEVMLQQNKPGYLSATQSFKEGFENIKTHEVATYAAMQKALSRLMEDLAPDRIEDKVGGTAFGGKKAKAWEVYVERWNAKTEHYENGILDVFLSYFAEAYDGAGKK